MKVFRSIKAIVLMVALMAGVQAQAQQSGTIAGMTPAVAAAAGIGVIAAGFLIADALDDDDDDPVAGPPAPPAPPAPPTTTTVAPMTPPAATTST